MPCAALLVRADRDDAEYVELATRYASSIRRPAPAGEGVLITSRWVVTSAATAGVLREIKPTPDLSIAGRKYEIDAIHTDGVIALIYLARAVPGVKPMPVYRGADEAGKVIAVVAHGPTGKQGTVPTGQPDGKKRAGINTIDHVADKTLLVRVKSGDEASDLQGVLVPGESGAGAYVSDAEGDIFLAGIAQSTDGKVETYVRLSQRFGWIEETMIDVAKREALKLLGSDSN